MKNMDVGKLEMIVVHCSATKPDRDIDAVEIKRWHTGPHRNFSDIGYHYVIKRNGTIQRGRPLMYQGAHAKGHNNSIGICLVGGASSAGKSEFNFTKHQMTALETLCLRLVNKIYMKPLKVVGHRDLTKYKACPCFDVESYFDNSVISPKLMEANTIQS